MKKIKSFYELEILCCSMGFSHTINSIVELCRLEFMESPRTTIKAQETILLWWNRLREKPSIKEHRLSYILLYILRKDMESDL